MKRQKKKQKNTKLTLLGNNTVDESSIKSLSD